MGQPILTLKGKINRDRTLSIRPFVSVPIINWDEVYYLVGIRGYFNVIPTYKKNTIVSVEIVKFLRCK
jgi:hypothetical protein